MLLPQQLGIAKSKPKFTQVFSKSPAINWLSRRASSCLVRAMCGSWSVCRIPVFGVGLVVHTGRRFSRAVDYRLRHRAGECAQNDTMQPSRQRAGRRHGAILGFILVLLPAAMALALMRDIDRKVCS